nr:uncharacterized protein LOC103351158 [Oryctolagus cuniculus]
MLSAVFTGVSTRPEPPRPSSAPGQSCIFLVSPCSQSGPLALTLNSETGHSSSWRTARPRTSGPQASSLLAQVWLQWQSLPVTLQWPGMTLHPPMTKLHPSVMTLQRPVTKLQRPVPRGLVSPGEDSKGSRQPGSTDLCSHCSSPTTPSTKLCMCCVEPSPAPTGLTPKDCYIILFYFCEKTFAFQMRSLELQRICNWGKPALLI